MSYASRNVSVTSTLSLRVQGIDTGTRSSSRHWRVEINSPRWLDHHTPETLGSNLPLTRRHTPGEQRPPLLFYLSDCATHFPSARITYETSNVFVLSLSWTKQFAIPTLNMTSKKRINCNTSLNTSAWTPTRNTGDRRLDSRVNGPSDERWELSHKIMSFYIKRTSSPIQTGQQVADTEGYLSGYAHISGCETVYAYRVFET